MKTAEEIYQEMRDAFAQETGVDIHPQGDMAVRLYTLAVQVESLLAYADWSRRMCFPQTATGEYLDYHGEMRGIARGQAAKAKGEIQFSLHEVATEAVTVPAGTVCMTAGLVSFVTLTDGVIEVGETSCLVPAEAETAGDAGNVSAETITWMAEPPVSVTSCTNPAAFTGGLEREADEDLRGRILQTYQNMHNGTNADYYRAAALEVSGVAAVEVYPKKRGICTVDLVISGQGGMPDEDLLEAVESHIQEMREICVDVQVSAPKPKTVDVTAEIDVAASYEAEDVCTRTKAAISALFDGKLLGQGMLVAQLGHALYSLPGIYNYTITAPTADTAASPGVLPVLGTLSVTERVS